MGAAFLRRKTAGLTSARAGSRIVAERGPERLGSPTRSSPKKTRDLATLEAAVARAETGAGPTPSSVSPARASFERARPPARASWAPGEASQRAFAYRPDVYSRGFGVSISGVLGDARLAQSGASAAAKTSRGPPGTGARDPDPDPEWEWQGSWQRGGRPRWRAPTAPRAATPPAKTRDAASREARPGWRRPRFRSRDDAPSPGSPAAPRLGRTPKGLAETICAHGRRGRRGLTGVDAQPEPRAVRRERGRNRGAAPAPAPRSPPMSPSRRRQATGAPGATASGAMRARRRRRSGTRTRAEPRGRGWTCEGTRAARCFTNAPRIFLTPNAPPRKEALLYLCPATNDVKNETPGERVSVVNERARLFLPRGCHCGRARRRSEPGSIDHERAFKHDARDAPVQVRGGPRRLHPRARRDRVSPRVIFSRRASFPSRSRLFETLATRTEPRGDVSADPRPSLLTAGIL